MKAIFGFLPPSFSSRAPTTTLCWKARITFSHHVELDTSSTLNVSDRREDIWQIARMTYYMAQKPFTFPFGFAPLPPQPFGDLLVLQEGAAWDTLKARTQALTAATLDGEPGVLVRLDLSLEDVGLHRICEVFFLAALDYYPVYHRNINEMGQVYSEFKVVEVYRAEIAVPLRCDIVGPTGKATHHLDFATLRINEALDEATFGLRRKAHTSYFDHRQLRRP